MDERAELRQARVKAKALVDDLRHELDGIIAGQDDPPDDEHDVEGSSIAFERERVRALLALAEARLTAIDGMAEDDSSATGRTCEQCGDLIGEERMLAVPGTRRCVSCATQQAPPLGRSGRR